MRACTGRNWSNFAHTHAAKLVVEIYKIARQATPQMAADKEADGLSRVHFVYFYK